MHLGSKVDIKRIGSTNLYHYIGMKVVNYKQYLIGQYIRVHIEAICTAHI